MICLKGNAARPINKQKKDELKNVLTNLRPKKLPKNTSKRIERLKNCQYKFIVIIHWWCNSAGAWVEPFIGAS